VRFNSTYPSLVLWNIYDNAWGGDRLLQLIPSYFLVQMQVYICICANSSAQFLVPAFQIVIDLPNLCLYLLVQLRRFLDIDFVELSFGRVI